MGLLSCSPVINTSSNTLDWLLGNPSALCMSLSDISMPTLHWIQNSNGGPGVPVNAPSGSSRGRHCGSFARLILLPRSTPVFARSGWHCYRLGVHPGKILRQLGNSPILARNESCCGVFLTFLVLRLCFMLLLSSPS